MIPKAEEINTRDIQEVVIEANEIDEQDNIEITKIEEIKLRVDEQVTPAGNDIQGKKQGEH